MSGFLIAVFVILWVVSAINSVRKAVAKAQTAAGGPDAVRAANANAAAQAEIAARNDATQRAARVLRSRMQQAAVATTPTVSVQKSQMPAYVAPPADQAMTSLIAMEAPSMPTFDAPGLDTGSAAYSFGMSGSTRDNRSAANAFAGRAFLAAEGANAGAAAIVASAVIGPPVGLRSGPLSASDW
jgi:hypothetical protein